VVHATPAAAGAAAAAAAAGTSAELGSLGCSLSMEGGMLDLPEPESMSWRPGEKWLFARGGVSARVLPWVQL
jgi:hypothetical protein